MKLFGSFLLLCLVALEPGCSNKGNPEKDQALEQKIKEFRSDYVIEPAVSKILGTQPADFAVKGGKGPYKIEIVEGGGRVQHQQYNPGSFIGSAVLKFTDQLGHVSHAAVIVAEPPKIVLDERSPLSPCQTTGLKATGGFAPYKFVASDGAEILTGPNRLKAPSKMEILFSVTVIDSKGYKGIAELSTRRSSKNYCFAENGKLKFPESKNPISHIPGRNFLSFVPTSMASSDSKIFVGGIELDKNDFLGIGFCKNWFGDWETYRRLYQPRLSVRSYDVEGQPNRVFGVQGTYIVKSFQKELSRADAIAIQPDGKILVSGVSFREDGARYLVVRLRSDGNLDETFGQNGIFESPLYGALPSNIVEGVFGYGFDRFLQVNKIHLQNPEQGGRILVYLTFRPRQKDGMKFTSEIVGLLPNGKIDSTFGENGKIMAPVSEETPFNEITDMAMNVQGDIIALQTPGFKIKGKITIFDKNGKTKNTFGKNGQIALNDPYYSKRYNSRDEKEDVGAVTYDDFTSSLDAFREARFGRVLPGSNDNLMLVGTTDVSGVEGELRCFLKKQKGGFYTAACSVKADPNRSVLRVKVFEQGVARPNNIIVGTSLYADYFEAKSFALSFMGSNHREILGGDRNESLLGLNLIEKDEIDWAGSRAANRVNVLTDGGLYQYFIFENTK